MLDRKNLSLTSIIETLKTYHENIDVDDSDSDKAQAGWMQKMILENLIAFLVGCS